MQTACVVFVHYCQHCLPCQEGIEIGWIIWHLDQIPSKGVEEPKASYANFPVKASACVECGVCMERCPFDVEIIAKMSEAAKVFEGQAT
jgi:predicted aldo/keto reductase-like oxidoreductase